MVDGWMGDDWFHYGAFRQPNIDYFLGQTAKRGEGVQVPREASDEYTNLFGRRFRGCLCKGSGHGATSVLAGDAGAPDVRRVLAKPGAGQADRPSAAYGARPCGSKGCGTRKTYGEPSTVTGRSKAKGTPDSMNNLVMGPWSHSQINREGRSLGPLTWATDTTAQWRREVLLPFFNQYLKAGLAYR